MEKESSAGQLFKGRGYLFVCLYGLMENLTNSTSYFAAIPKRRKSASQSVLLNGLFFTETRVLRELTLTNMSNVGLRVNNKGNITVTVTVYPS